MRATIIFRAVIKKKDGTKYPEITNKKFYQKSLNQFREGEIIKITFENYKSKRTLDQNAYYWGIVLPTVSEDTGDSEAELHEFFKRKFITPRFITACGERIRIPGSTAKLSKSDFCDYIMRIEALTGLKFPDPDKTGYSKI